jgi:hypothetical protein
MPTSVARSQLSWLGTRPGRLGPTSAANYHRKVVTFGDSRHQPVDRNLVSTSGSLPRTIRSVPSPVKSISDDLVDPRIGDGMAGPVLADRDDGAGTPTAIT